MAEDHVGHTPSPDDGRFDVQRDCMILRSLHEWRPSTINAATGRDHLTFIAELAASLREAQARPGISAEERGRYQRWLAHADSLQSLLGMGRPGISRADDAASHADLPAALLRELNPRKADQLETQIIAVLAACNGSADLDQVLVGLYRGFGVIGKRRVIQNKLWRLVRTGRISKEKKRNVFSLSTSGERPRRKNKASGIAPRRLQRERRRKAERTPE